jgi:hypothetical protein
MSLNSLKELVNIEGMSFFFKKIISKLLIKFEDQSLSETPQLKYGILKQFVDNLEFDNPNTLRIIRMKSHSGVESFPFSSDHTAWRETASNPYCVYDRLEESSLRWTDVSTRNAVQFWRMAPAGFGIFFDIRSGYQLVIIATTVCANNVGGCRDFFTQWGRYLEDTNRLDPALFSGNDFEAIRLEPGNRL